MLTVRSEDLEENFLISLLNVLGVPILPLRCQSTRISRSSPTQHAQATKHVRIA